MPILPGAPAPVNPSDNGLTLPPGIIAARLRGIAERTGDGELAALARETGFIEDRLTLAECEIHHLRSDLERLTALTALEVPR